MELADIDKTFGAISKASGGFNREQVDIDRWLESTTRALKAYIDNGISDVFEIIVGFPAADELAKLPSLERTLIHLEIEDIEPVKFGMGDNVVDALYDEDDFLITGVEAQCFEITFDVGVWASYKSGGSTARMRAYQHLTRLLHGPSAFKEARNKHDFEILRFNGGTFAREEVGEVPIFRVVAMELVVRVYARKFDSPVTFVETVVQDPDLEIAEGQEIVG